MHAQHPREALVQFIIDRLEVLQVHLLIQHHLIEPGHEIRIQEPMMEHRESEHASYEFEIIEMFRVDAGRRVDLQRIVIVCRIFEQAIAGVEHLVREEEEPLARDATIIERVFAFKFHHQALPEVLGPEPHNRRKAIFEHPSSAYTNVTLSVRNKAHRRLAPEIHHLAPIVPFILGSVRVDRRRQTRIVPGGSARVVVDEVYTPGGRHAHFPAGWQGAQCGAIGECVGRGGRCGGGTPTRIVPRGRARMMIDEIGPAVWSTPFFPSERQTHVRVGAVRISRVWRQERRICGSAAAAACWAR